MALIGMDIAGVRTFGQQLDTAAGEIEAIVNRLTSGLAGTEWVGPDADKFRGEWESAHSAALRTVADQLVQTAVLARSNADAQESTSAS